MTSKEFIPLNRPTPTSFPIHLSWSPCMWFFYQVLLSRDAILTAKFISPQNFCWTSVPARGTWFIIGTRRC
jgi:hypothetical protein